MQKLKTIYQIFSSTPDRRQSKTLQTIDERGSIIARNSVFYCHLSPVGRQMTIENSVSNDNWSTFVDSINVFDCRLSGVSSALEKNCIFVLKSILDCKINNKKKLYCTFIYFRQASWKNFLKKLFFFFFKKSQQTTKTWPITSMQIDTDSYSI